MQNINEARMIKIDVAEIKIIQDYLYDLAIDLVPSFVVKYNREALDYPHDSNFNFKISCLQNDCLNQIQEGKVMPGNIFLGLLKITRSEEALKRATIDDDIYFDDGDIYDEELDHKRDGYINNIQKLVSLHEGIANHAIKIFTSDVFKIICNKQNLFRPKIAITDEELLKEIKLVLVRKLQPTPEMSVS